MKNSKLKFIFLISSMVCIIITNSCKKSSSSSSTPTPTCSTTGTSANDGVSPSSVNVGGSDWLEFFNSSQSFHCTGTMLDAGTQTCLDFTYSGTSTSATAPYTNGHGYVGTYTDGHIVKFIAGAYNSGNQTVNISYVYK
jgi:hypothetical protein